MDIGIDFELANRAVVGPCERRRPPRGLIGGTGVPARRGPEAALANPRTTHRFRERLTLHKAHWEDRELHGRARRPRRAGRPSHGSLHKMPSEGTISAVGHQRASRVGPIYGKLAALPVGVSFVNLMIQSSNLPIRPGRIRGYGQHSARQRCAVAARIKRANKNGAIAVLIPGSDATRLRGLQFSGPEPSGVHVLILVAITVISIGIHVTTSCLCLSLRR